MLLIDPVSSGSFLAAAFAESGAETVHAYGTEFADRAAADPHPRSLVLSETGDYAELEHLGVTEVVAASEFGVTRASEIADHLGMAHHGSYKREARRSKPAMQRALEEAGVPSLRTHEVSSVAEAADVVSRMNAPHRPHIVKPRESAGGDGCSLVTQSEKIVPTVESLLGQSNLMGQPNTSVLIQDYAEGPQYIVNTVSSFGQHYLSEIYYEHIDERSGSPVLRHITSLSYLDEDAQAIVDYTFSCLDALEILHGAAHSEVRLTPDGPRLVEVNSRVMGPRLDPDPYMLAFGYTHQHLVVEQVLSPTNFTTRMSRPYQPQATLCKVFLRSPNEGVLAGSPGLETLRRLPGFHSVVCLPTIGRPLQDIRLTTAKTGVAYFVHEDASLIASSVRAIHDLEDAGEFFRVQPCAT
ncbi:ATP-grasp domain-containing protein [Actinopolyspora mortivallis]|uniref:ATP-grasp domain-containing protein n=1 Tax=Actinopolyspora mortivallis TaxID=33906 RepID=UPI001C6382AE|nr:ATP-grasp domain-containing protein [Actinopolyspora mortivallis]